ncbi:hypothetical protein ACPEEZ_11940 [Frigoribacterium sp. 2-23]|uniref:hypothetical protein n=1 Tax=Frigoribacterium sp. 2-23 TaxID=3415006 RepID=UPI003C6EE952
MRSITPTGLIRSAAGIAAVGALAFGLAACASTSDSASNNTAPTHRANPTVSAEPSATETPLATLPSLTKGVDTKVAVDSSFVSALTSLGLTPGVVGTATFTDGTFSFPITGGNVTYYDPDGDVRPYVQGDVQHDGSGLSLTAGSTVVELKNFDIDPGASKLYGDVVVNGETVASHAYLFNLWGGSLKPLQMQGDNAVLTGTTVHISPDAAGLLNSTFKTDAVQDEMLVGVATITVATK